MEWTRPAATSNKISIFSDFLPDFFHAPARRRDNACGLAKGLDMHMHAAMGDERTLRRIMALLVSLASLAELAAARSSPVRWLVLFILRRAEVLAREFVFEATGAPLPVEGIAAAGNGPADALRLAARLHALAAALHALLPGRSARAAGDCLLPCRIAAAALATAAKRQKANRPLHRNDTS